MWGSFFAAMAFFIAIVYVPGFFYLKAFRFSWAVSLCCAPLVSIAFYSVFSIGLYFVGAHADWIVLAVPFVLTGFVALIASYALNRRKKASVDGDSLGVSRRGVEYDVIAAILYVLCGLAAVLWVFVRNLGDPASFMQAVDNIHHLGDVYASLQTGNYSSFGMTLYPGADAAERPFTDDAGGFYPSAWHCLVTMTASAVGVPVTVAVNAVNAAVAGVVFPLSVFIALRHLFTAEKRVVFYGAATCIGCAAFPWGFLIFGPLYPNMLAFAISPLLVYSFIKIFEKHVSVSSRVRYAFLVVCGLACALFAQPNMVFFVVAMLMPFCAIGVGCLLSRRVRNVGKRRVVAICGGLLFVVFTGAVWYAFFRAPFMRGLVEFDWPNNTGAFQALVDIVTLGLTERCFVHVVLSVFVLVGFIRCLCDKRYRWLAFSYIAVCVLYFSCVATGGFVKHFLSGFWYTDPFRLAAMVAIAAVPLSAFGVSGIVDFVSRLFSVHVSSEKALGVLSFVIVLILLVSPSFTLRGVGFVATPLGHAAAFVRDFNMGDIHSALTHEEMDFAERALEVVPDDSLIITNPNDGSAFLYSVAGADLYYRYASGYGGDTETQASRTIRLDLSDIAHDGDVREAVEDIGAKYVLLFDVEKEPVDRGIYLISYDPQQWVGIDSINDSTDGFTPILSEGDMRLYAIDGM